MMMAELSLDEEGEDYQMKVYSLSGSNQRQKSHSELNRASLI